MKNRLLIAMISLGICGQCLLAQTTPGFVTAEATHTIRMKPNMAKIFLGVESKAGTATESAETNLNSRKELVAAIDKLGFKNITVKYMQQKVTKDRDNSSRLRGGGVFPGGNPVPAPVESYSAIYPVIFTISEPDPAKLVETVEKVNLTAANLGVTSDRGIADTTTNFLYGETKYGARVVYSAKEGWDDVMAPALKKATERAFRNASALAEGANLKVRDIIAVEDLTDGVPQESGSSSIDPRSVSPSLRGLLIGGSEDELQEGDLVRKVRVRVKVAVSR